MNTFRSNMNERDLHGFLILEAISRLYEYFLSIQTIQFLIFAYFSDDIFCIINTHLFSIILRNIQSILFFMNKLLIIQ